ncbi:18263_t:CDS:2, partial [Gigaspora rosea]
EPSGNELFEDDPDSILVCARFLLDQLDKANIEEFMDDKQANYSNRSFGLPQLSICENNQEHMNDDLIDQQLFYETVWGLIRTATNKCILHNDNEFVKMIDNYLNNIRKREKKHNKMHQ